MEWEVEFTDEFSNWWDGLSDAEQVDVNAKVIQGVDKAKQSIGLAVCQVF